MISTMSDEMSDDSDHEADAAIEPSDGDENADAAAPFPMFVSETDVNGASTQQKYERVQKRFKVPSIHIMPRTLPTICFRRNTAAASIHPAQSWSIRILSAPTWSS